MRGLYYTAPSDESFDDLKNNSIAFWKEGDRHPNYVEEKVGYIEGVKNISDNFMTILAMFDINNQRRIALRLKPGTIADINDRLIDGGNSYILGVGDFEAWRHSRGSNGAA